MSTSKSHKSKKTSKAIDPLAAFAPTKKANKTSSRNRNAQSNKVSIRTATNYSFFNKIFIFINYFNLD
jgi:hypothetical protein